MLKISAGTCCVLVIPVSFILYTYRAYSTYYRTKEGCVRSVKRHLGHVAFYYDQDTQQCERVSEPTCLRADDTASTKKVFMSTSSS